MAYRGLLAGAIRFAETVDPKAVEAVSALQSMGLDVHLLSGDGRANVESVARQLAVKNFDSDMNPRQKLVKVQELQREGKRIVMVGDGINDAAALSKATVGIAMSSSTGLDSQTASILLPGNDLLACADLL